MDSLLAARLGMTTASSPAHKPVAVPPKQGDPGQHLTAAHAAHKKGDHHGAKKHALKAVNALHRMAPAPADPSAPVAPAA